MCKLTALQELELSGCLKRRYLVHVGMLTALLALRKLALGGAIELTAGEGWEYMSRMQTCRNNVHMHCMPNRFVACTYSCNYIYWYSLVCFSATATAALEPVCRENAGYVQKVCASP
jgi:hypothetical protein